MPLVVLSGHPCSGKSTVARKLRDILTAEGLLVKLVSESELFQDRNASYRDLPSEKNTRAKLRSEVDRHCSKTTIVLLDTLNNIKGYRYELWCIAKAVGTRYCILWCDTPASTCEEWNSARPVGQAYDKDVLADLLGRFEAPNAQNRWDAPLFKVSPSETSDLGADLQAVVAGLTSEAGNRPTVGPNAVVSKELKPTLATMSSQVSQANLLYELDKAAQEVIQTITAAQSQAGTGAAGRIEIHRGLDIVLQEPVLLADLRRLKRGFVKLATSGMGYTLQAGQPSVRAFVAYLRDNLKGVAQW